MREEELERAQEGLADAEEEKAKHEETISDISKENAEHTREEDER